MFAEIVQLRKNNVLSAQFIRLGNKLYMLHYLCNCAAMPRMCYADLGMCNSTLWPAVCAYGTVGVSHLHSGIIHFHLLSPISTANNKEKRPDVCFPLSVVINFHGIFKK